MKRILYLSFYFDPDLCAGSFRNTPLSVELSRKLSDADELVVITTMPNRYNTFKADAAKIEKKGNMIIHRICIPEHKGGFSDQILSFYAYYEGVMKMVRNENFHLVFASSSRLFTAYLGYKIASRKGIPLYLDIRDIFVDTMKDILKNQIVKAISIPFLRRIEKITFSYAIHINLISAGFESYFRKYCKAKFSYYSNGIDDQFIGSVTNKSIPNQIKKIVYAGNIGEGQGLHIIVPKIAKMLKNTHEFIIIGDGGAKEVLKKELHKSAVTNVILMDPVKRTELIKLYSEADFLFLHLNDYEAFKKVLPSKIFELGASGKPIIAGVGGYAQKFIRDNIPNTILFEPGNASSLMKQLGDFQYQLMERGEFITKFKRSKLNKEMADSIIGYLL